ncbi:hypothetical protein MOD96_01680 [Bacillus sp. S17B2]|uniref:hypothetical protein n=1 Tax=Bacillus sp. S17B2 TaxID=2918907 RepID=UPI00227DA731|nr:hypothetical protein [Bacillus sp. S17B2]
MEQYHGYVCEKGCGHTTVVNKYYKQKQIYCDVCGSKDQMKYLGEYQVSKKEPTKLTWGNHNV